MALVDHVIRFSVTPFGAWLDRFSVHWAGHSVINFLFSITTGVRYNTPLLLTTIGAKTGLRRTVVLPYFPADKDIAIVGSKGGMPTDPYWVSNLRAHSQVWIRKNRKNYTAATRIAQGEERARLWESITKRSPVYLEYQERATTREIPVVILELSVAS